MTRSQERSKRKSSGGRYIKAKKKRLNSLSGNPTLTKYGTTKKKIKRTRGGHKKIILLNTDTINVLDPKTKQTKKVKIHSLKENKANPHYVRRGILTKGTIVETELGLAKITSRPGQEATLNAVLLKK